MFYDVAMKPNTLCSRLQCPHVQKKVTRVPARMVKHDKMPSRGAPPVPCPHAGAPLQTAGALYIYIYIFFLGSDPQTSFVCHCEEAFF